MVTAATVLLLVLLLVLELSSVGISRSRKSSVAEDLLIITQVTRTHWPLSLAHLYTISMKEMAVSRRRAMLGLK